MIQKSTVKEKLQTFFELADLDGNGSIDPEEMLNLLKKSYKTSSSLQGIRKIVKQIFMIADVDNDGDITKAELIKAAENSDYLKDIVEKIVKEYR